jgi:hypothetical protein
MKIIAAKCLADYQYNPARFSPRARGWDFGIRKNLLALMGAKEYY